MRPRLSREGSRVDFVSFWGAFGGGPLRKGSQKGGRKRVEATATREQREAIKGEEERKDKESTQVSKQTSTSKQAIIRVWSFGFRVCNHEP